MWDVKEHTSTGRVNLSEFIKEALNTLVPKNAQRDTVEVIIPESATGHLVSGSTIVLVKFWLPDEEPKEFFAVEDGDPEFLPEEEYLGPDTIEISQNH